MGRIGINEVFAFEVWPVWNPEWSRVVNQRTLGKAKSEFYNDLRESWDCKFTDIRGRKIGKACTDATFAHVARIRGMPELQCGQRVSFKTTRNETVSGVLVTAGGGANFGVLCDKDSQWSDRTIYVHPSELIIEEKTNAESPL